MKKVLKSNVFAFILGALIFGGIGAVSAYAILASDIGFTPKDSTWKKSDGTDITNVKDAIDELYLNSNLALKPVLLWTNSNLSSNFAAQTLSLDLSNYKYVIIVSRTSTTQDYKNRASSILPVGGTAFTGVGVSRDRAIRYAKASTTGIEFKIANYGLDEDNTFSIPYKIYGIKGELDLDLWMD